MGWLRKVGRKISKKLGKVFGSKLGSVIGAVGLYMLMGPVAKTLTGWASSAFGGAGAAASGTAATATTAATTTGASTAASAAAAESAIAAGTQGINAASTLSEASLLAGENLATQAATTSAANQTVAGQIANATNNMDMANSAISAIDSASVTGSLNVSPTITDSLIQDAVPALDQTVSTVQSNIQNINTSGITFDNTGIDLTQTVKPTVVDTSSLPIDGVISPKAPEFVATDDIIMDTAMEDTMNQEVIDSQKNIFVKGFDKVKGYFNDDFVGDTIQGVTTGTILGALQGEPEDVGGYGRLPGAPAMEAAQANYIQSVGPSAMAATGMTRMPSFQELSQQTLYGTGSANYLSQFYQPLATPSIG